MSKQTHYPTYNVMEEQQAWDANTRDIVKSRLAWQHNYHFLTLQESELLRAWCARLVDDDRAEIIGYVLSHIDQKLSQPKGEGQRCPNVPEASELIRSGIHDVGAIAHSVYGTHFYQMDPAQQHSLMHAISTGEGQQGDERLTVPPVAFFDKLLVWTVEAYYSHPKVWSEIGYGGPAYPRGYVRLEKGQLDPWEAKPE